MIKLIPCKLSSDTFSGELIFEVETTEGPYIGIMPRLGWSNKGLAALEGDNIMDVHVTPDGRVVLPDGECVRLVDPF